MRVAMISCWFRDQLYSDYTLGLVEALRAFRVSVDVVTGDCVCALRDDAGFSNLVDPQCRTVDFRFLPNPKGRAKAVKAVRKFLRDWRIGKSFLAAAGEADVIHFQEVTNAFGTTPVLSFLAGSSRSRRVVTVHELERFTDRFRSLYSLYNRADAVIVHSRSLRDELVELGVDERLIHIVPMGARVASVIPDRRQGVVYYGGHHLFSGKGFEDFLQALVILNRSGDGVRATVVGYFASEVFEAARKRAEELGVERFIIWYNNPSREVYERAFAEAAVAVIPFRGGNAAFPAAQALAHGTPVVATRVAEIQEYLGNLARYVDPDAPVHLAAAVDNLLESEQQRRQLSEKMLERAHRTCDWQAVAERTLRIYRGEEALLDPDPWAAREVMVA